MLIKETDNVLFKCQGDNTEVYVVAHTNSYEVVYTNSYEVVWGDYFANAWKESYDSFGTALARAAVLVYASEQSPNFSFVQSSEEEFAQSWEEAMSGFVSDIED
jgi:hypothetical protein